MVQLFSLAWGLLNTHLLFNFDKSDEYISLEILNKFFTMAAIKHMVFCILGYFIIFEATGFFLCYLYLNFNIITKVIFWISIIISSLLMIATIIAINSMIDDFIKMKNNSKEVNIKNDSEDEELTKKVEKTLHFIIKLNLILLIILSVLLFKLFIY